VLQPLLLLVVLYGLTAPLAWLPGLGSCAWWSPMLISNQAPAFGCAGTRRRSSSNGTGGGPFAASTVGNASLGSLPTSRVILTQ
jgi:hypothetical protein